MSEKHPTPSGIKFYDQASRQRMLLSEDGWTKGWLLYHRPSDGQWVTLRQATKDDIARINLAAATGIGRCVLVTGEAIDAAMREPDA